MTTPNFEAYNTDWGRIEQDDTGYKRVIATKDVAKDSVFGYCKTFLAASSIPQGFFTARKNKGVWAYQKVLSNDSPGTNATMTAYILAYERNPSKFTNESFKSGVSFFLEYCTCTVDADALSTKERKHISRVLNAMGVEDAVADDEVDAMYSRVCAYVFSWCPYTFAGPFQGMVTSLVSPIGLCMNTACVPNTAWSFEDASTLVLYALEDIKAGDEIRINYGHLPQSAEAKKLVAEQRGTMHPTVPNSIPGTCNCGRCDEALEMLRAERDDGKPGDKEIAEYTESLLRNAGTGAENIYTIMNSDKWTEKNDAVKEKLLQGLGNRNQIVMLAYAFTKIIEGIGTVAIHPEYTVNNMMDLMHAVLVRLRTDEYPVMTYKAAIAFIYPFVITKLEADAMRKGDMHTKAPVLVNTLKGFYEASKKVYPFITPDVLHLETVVDPKEEPKLSKNNPTAKDQKLHKNLIQMLAAITVSQSVCEMFTRSFEAPKA